MHHGKKTPIKVHVPLEVLDKTPKPQNPKTPKPLSYFIFDVNIWIFIIFGYLKLKEESLKAGKRLDYKIEIEAATLQLETSL